jgi:hypothetical protein
MQGGKLVAGAAVRLDRISPTVEHDEGVQVDSATTIGMSKITHGVNSILIVAGPQL